MPRTPLEGRACGASNPFAAYFYISAAYFDSDRIRTRLKKPLEILEMRKNTCFRSQCSLVTLVHVHWATYAQHMSGLHMC